MGTVSLPNLDSILQIKDPDKRFEELVNTVGILIKNLSEINGYINSKNVFEVGGWRVNSKDMSSIDKDVGMSTEDTTADDTRFWAGSPDKDTAPWRVTKSGKMTATGALIQSSDDSYPRVVFDPDSDLFGAYATATNFINIKASDAGEPLLYFDNGVNLIRHALLGNTYNLGVVGNFDLAATDNLTIQGTGTSSTITLKPGTGASGRVTVPSWTKLYSTGDIQSLQTALNAKANSFSGATSTVYVATTSGGPATTPISFSNGIRTT
ncbi:hypothetical protein [Paenibacillus harenae]|uniref:hypothetical protein n=1 Tax=Paenibacillus harenae TaxID=306543 RepID=UPI0027920AA4|nr:hypothetical protein [Paenibacillus harenae]MDQ0062389.1 hypothetical protein [Paenibacillus harenae]